MPDVADNIVTGTFTFLALLVTVAIFSEILSSRNDTSQVIQASSSGVASDFEAAMGGGSSQGGYS